MEMSDPSNKYLGGETQEDYMAERNSTTNTEEQQKLKNEEKKMNRHDIERKVDQLRQEKGIVSDQYLSDMNRLMNKFEFDQTGENWNNIEEYVRNYSLGKEIEI